MKESTPLYKVDLYIQRRKREILIPERTIPSVCHGYPYTFPPELGRSSSKLTSEEEKAAMGVLEEFSKCNPVYILEHDIGSRKERQKALFKYRNIKTTPVTFIGEHRIEGVPTHKELYCALATIKNGSKKPVGALEILIHLHKKKATVSNLVRDVELNQRSVNITLSNLVAQQLVYQDGTEGLNVNRYYKLTEKGKEIAEHLNVAEYFL